MPESIDLMIVGSQKCGTSSLQRYLEVHPAVVSHHTMEFSYFGDEDEWSSGFDAAWKRHFTQGGKRIVAKCAGLCLNTTALRRLAEHNPLVQVTLLIRDPISRAYSSYLMDKSLGRPLPDFETALATALRGPETTYEYRSFLGYGDYFRIALDICRYVPREQLSIFTLDELHKSPRRVCDLLCRAMSIAPMPEFEPRVHNAGKNHRSKLVARALYMANRHGEPVKRIVRSVLPRRVSTRLGSFLRDVNREPTRPQAISPQAQSWLADFYAERNERFEREFGIVVPRHE